MALRTILWDSWSHVISLNTTHIRGAVTVLVFLDGHGFSVDHAPCTNTSRQEASAVLGDYRLDQEGKH